MPKAILVSLLLLLFDGDIDKHPHSLMPGDATGSLYLSSIPPRPGKAIGGSAFVQKTTDLTGRQRQQAAVREICGGNIPEYLRKFKPVILTQLAENGVDTVKATIWVSPDYISIGSEKDFLRMPLTYPSAITVASKFGCVLPTPKMVDAIYQQADFHFQPKPMKPGKMMRSCGYYLRHQKDIEFQRGKRPLQELVAGHKKDVVITNSLWKKSDRIAIYGWHKGEDNPIQPLSTVHGARYADYSHSLRLINEYAYFNGQYRLLYDLLEDSLTASVFSYEGRIKDYSLLMNRKFK